MTDLDERVTVHVASFNTRPATELCIRSMRMHASHAFELVVGDGGSTDGSLEMLRDFERRGWLTLQRQPRRTHAAWLDAWRSEPPSRYLVFVDSDMEFRRPGWLHGLIARARVTGAALVALDIRPMSSNVREPVSGRLVRAMPAPTTWLLMLDTLKLADVEESFAFRAIDTESVPEGCVIYDTGAALLEQVRARDLAIATMSDAYRAGVKHYGSMSWMPLGGEAGLRKLRNLAVIERRLRAVRALDSGSPSMSRRLLARAVLSPRLEDVRELAARARRRVARSLGLNREERVFAPDLNAAFERDESRPE